MQQGKRYPEVLVAPVITFIAVAVLLVVARFYDRMPVKPPSCSFREVFSVPCVSCGGTRSFKALAHGDFLAAVQFNPAAIIGVIVAGLWLVRGIFRYKNNATPLSPEKSRKQIIRNTVIAGVLLVLNWIYLIQYLP